MSLKSRYDEDLCETYPELVEALQRDGGSNWVVDGEVVAFKGRVTSFERLQQRMKIRDRDAARQAAKSTAVYYYLFDLLYVDGYDVTGLALRDRKRLLKNLLTWKNPIRYCTHRREQGERYHRVACERHWEGVIAKSLDSGYVHSRSRNWLKFKCTNRQEFVIGGFTDPKGSRLGFGALLLGYCENGDLRYAGMVGAGFDDETLEELHGRLKGLEARKPSYADRELPSKGVHWVKPKLVAEVAYTELTRKNRLRHPRFLGLRRKKARTVGLEHDGSRS